MAYQRVNWADGEEGNTPMTADNLNKMDAGIFRNSEDIEELKEKATNVKVNPILTTGTKIAEITVDEETKGIYAPPGGGGGTDFVILTQEEYDALPDSKYTDGIEYRIKASPMNAYNMSYKDTSVGDELDNQKQNIADQQSAINLLNNKLDFKRKTLSGTSSAFGYLTTDMDYDSYLILRASVEGKNGYYAAPTKLSNGKLAFLITYVSNNTSKELIAYINSTDFSINIVYLEL